MREHHAPLQRIRDRFIVLVVGRWWPVEPDPRTRVPPYRSLGTARRRLPPHGHDDEPNGRCPRLNPHSLAVATLRPAAESSSALASGRATCRLAYCCRLFGEFTRNETSAHELAEATGARSTCMTRFTRSVAAFAQHNGWSSVRRRVPRRGRPHVRGVGRSLAHEAARRESSLASWRQRTGRRRRRVRRPQGSGNERASTPRRTISKVTVGATGAPRRLHFSAPGVLPPWDDPMRAALGMTARADGYVAYLKGVQDHVRKLEREAAAFGIAPSDIPRFSAARRRACRRDRRVLLGALTRGHFVPDPAELARWYKGQVGAAALSATRGSGMYGLLVQIGSTRQNRRSRRLPQQRRRPDDQAGQGFVSATWMRSLDGLPHEPDHLRHRGSRASGAERARQGPPPGAPTRFVSAECSR